MTAYNMNELYPGLNPEDSITFNQSSSTFTNAVTMSSTLAVTGAVTLSGNLSVTGDLDVDGDFTFGDAITDSITCYGLLKMGTNSVPLVLTAGTPIFTLYTTCSGTSGSTNAEPFYMKSVLTGAGQVGGRAYFLVTSNVASGGWVNAIKGDIEFGSSGSTSGLASAICAEMTMPNQTVPSGQYYPMEIEMIAGASTGTAGTAGSGCGFIYAKISGTATDFDDEAGMFWLDGISAGAGHMLSANDNTIRCFVTSSMTPKYILLSDAEDCLSIDSCTTSITIGDSVTTGIDIGAVTTGISFTETSVTTGINFVNGFTGKAIKVGSLSSDTPGSGLILDDTTTRAVEVNADDNDSSLLTATLARAIMGRYMVYANSSNENWGIDGLCKWSAVASTGNVTAGIVGRFETTGTCSTATGSGNTYCAGVMGRVGTAGSFTIGSGTYVACVLAFGNNQNSNAFTNAGYHAFHAALTDISTPETFDYGLFIEDSASVAGVYVGDCTSGIVFGTCSGTAIDFPAGETYGKAIAIGTFGNPIVYDTDELIEFHGQLGSVTESKPMMRVRGSTYASGDMTTGTLVTMQVQGYNVTTYDFLNIRGISCEVGAKGACELLTGGVLNAGYFKVEDLGNDLTATGDIYCIHLGWQFSTGSAINGESSYINLRKEGNINLDANSVMRFHDSSGSGVADNFLDFVAAGSPLISGDKSGNTGTYHLKCDIAGTTYCIQLYANS